MNTNNTSPKNSNDTKSRIMTISRVSFALLGITFVIINMITESEHSIWLVLGLLLHLGWIVQKKLMRISRNKLVSL